MSAKKRKGILIEVSIFVGVSIIVFLSLLNLISLNPKEVLGAETTNTPLSDTVFWENFLEEHPDYIPGWNELGRIDRVREIDPNYITP